MRFILFILAALHLTVGISAEADLPDARQVAVQIDSIINERLEAEGVTAAPLLNDEQFLRLVTLDLAGRIPTAAERAAFLSQAATDQQASRAKLVEQLIESPDYAYHTRNQLDILLLLRKQHDPKWREVLLEETSENRGWYRIFREIFQPEDTMSNDLTGHLGHSTQ